VETSKHHEANDSAEAVVQGGEPTGIAASIDTNRHSSKAGQARLRPNNRAQAGVEYEDRRAQPGTADNPISDDELAALDADNKRLKRLLAERLRAQNLRLKKMLERFDG